MLLEKDFYTTQEALLKIKTIIANFDESDLRYFGENEKLKFSLYVGSRPAYGAKYDYATKEMWFIGHCNLHGLFPIQQGDLCGILANDNHLIELLYGHPNAKYLEITNWSPTIPKDAQQANIGLESMWIPEQYNPELKFAIPFFYLRPKMALQLNVIKPGTIIPFNAIPENVIKSAIRFDHGKTVQWPESQIFNKQDLRITHENLQIFIDFLIQTKSSSSLSEKPMDFEESPTDKNEIKSVLEVGSLQWRKETARAAANTRHSQKGGSHHKQSQIREIWATGKYTSRDLCAEEECAGLGMSYSTARKALRNTPEPTIDLADA